MQQVQAHRPLQHHQRLRRLRKRRKSTKTKEAEAQKSNVLVPTGAGVGEGADVRPEGSGANGAAEKILDNTSPDTTKKSVTNPPKGGDIDDEITNARLRAATGSKSKISIQSAVNYNGGSLAKPVSPDRPKLSPGTIGQDPANLQATIAGKYRLTEHDNLNLGFGLQWNNPYHAAGYTDRGQAYDPYFAYGRLFKWGGIQNVFNTSFTAYTRKVVRDAKDVGEYDIDHTFLWGIGKTGLQLGVDFGWTHDFYSTNLHDPTNNVDELFIYPFLEQEISSVLSFRTVYRGITYFNNQTDMSTFVRDTVSQSAGLGITITRDFYLYPNIQWLWSHMEARKTNIAIDANINLF